MHLRTSRLLAAALAAVAACAPAAPAQSATAPPGPDAAAAVRMQTFLTVWTRVNEKFYDPSFNGVDWAAVREKYRPRVAALTDDAALYPLLGEMLGELKASHFGIMPPQAAASGDQEAGDDPSYGGDAGMTVRMVEGRPTITDVDAAGPAAAAGLRAGFVVTAIGRHDLSAAVERAASRSDRAAMRAFLVRRAAETFLGGMPGSKVDVAYLDASGAPKSATVVRRDAPGRPMKFGEMPTVLGQVEAKRLQGGVGYLRFNIFMLQLLDDVRAAIRSFKDAPGIVIDLRNNPGGVGMMAPAIASLFADKQTTLGTMKMRSGELNFVAFPQTDAFAGPLVILTDEGSASTSEVMAGGMQENGRATVVGSQSLGAVLPSHIEKLPNGALFQYAVADFRTPRGVLLEGRGVTPDVVVTPTRADYQTGRDLVLEAALQRILRPRAAGASEAP